MHFLKNFDFLVYSVGLKFEFVYIAYNDCKICWGVRYPRYHGSSSLDTISIKSLCTNCIEIRLFLTKYRKIAELLLSVPYFTFIHFAITIMLFL